MAKNIYSILSDRTPKKDIKSRNKRIREDIKARVMGEDPDVRARGRHINYWLSRGFTENPNLYIGDGHIHCVMCHKSTLHYAISKKVGMLQDNVLVCGTCDWGKYGG